MASDLSVSLTNSITPSKLLAAVDMGTNSFKLVLIRAEPNGRFLTIDRHKEQVLLGRGMLCNPTLPAITPESQTRAMLALQKFSQILLKQRVHHDHTRFVATSAVREAVNGHEFVVKIEQETNCKVEILTGEEEARLVYMGVLQFLPIYEKNVLTVDIGGGSTEFVVGKEGKVVFATSLKLGHVSLTEMFNGGGGIVDMRKYIRSVMNESGVIEKVGEIGFEIAVGSSGTIRAIEKAVYLGYARNWMSNVVSYGELGRSWRFDRRELGLIVEKLCGLDVGEEEEVRRNAFFKRRSEFICAGAILLLEIFEMLDINEMEVSEYALGEGVIAENLAGCSEDYSVGGNARWRLVVRLAMRFHTDRRMKVAMRCVSIAREIIAGLTKWGELNNQNKFVLSLGEKDIEYLDAACLLHNIGQFIGKKGYHKQSYHIIKNGDYLHGYHPEEVELIALLVKRHRKKVPRIDHSSLDVFSEEVKEKFRMLCAIVRISVAIQQCPNMNFQQLDTSSSPDSLKLVFSKEEDTTLPSSHIPSTMQEVEVELRKEIENFEVVVVSLDHHLTLKYHDSDVHILNCKLEGGQASIFSVSTVLRIVAIFLCSLYMGLLYSLYVPDWKFEVPSTNISLSGDTQMIDVKQIRWPTVLFQWMGMNVLIVYALAACELFLPPFRDCIGVLRRTIW